MSSPVAVVAGLTVRAADGADVLVDGHLTLRAGRITALTGPSGVGKTTLLRALLGHLPAGTVREAGTVTVDGIDPFALDPRERQRFRRGHVAYVGQDPGGALTPTMRVRTLLTEVASARYRADPGSLLEQVDLPARYLSRRPGRLSGGEQRRVAIARALGREVRVLIVDEPLAGLDARRRDGIVALLRGLADSQGIAVAVSGHDARALRTMADDVVDLSSTCPCPAPRRAGVPGAAGGRVLLRAEGLGATVDRGRTVLVRDVDLQVSAGEATALIGPSGAGKTTVGRVLLGVAAESSGRITLDGEPVPLRAQRRSRDHARRIAWVPQDPLSTLNPARTVGATLARPLARRRIVPRAGRDARVRELLRQVRLPDDAADRYPHELSGGQRQRVAIARALAADPDVVVCDEITSALDAGTADSIMELLAEVRGRRGLGLVLITHDMTLVERHCATVTVLGSP